MKKSLKNSTESCHFYRREKLLYVAWVCFRNEFGLNFISLYTHVQNDNVINTNEQVNDIQKCI